MSQAWDPKAVTGAEPDSLLVQPTKAIERVSFPSTLISYLGVDRDVLAVEAVYRRDGVKLESAECHERMLEHGIVLPEGTSSVKKEFANLVDEWLAKGSGRDEFGSPWTFEQLVTNSVLKPMG